MSAWPHSEALEFRRMARADICAVMEIERSAYRFGWTRGIFEDCLRAGYECWVLQRDGVIVGYGVLSLAAAESHVLNVCVDPNCQRQGYGALLMEHLIELASEQGAQQMWLEVRPSNKPARKLYASLGFESAGRRRGYYPEEKGREDALVLSRWLSPPDGGERG
ncbi:MAG TPA: ribosomal protein S18-alanine N-acetyltransferase [Gammaproteobacteria bacterium]|nr:ribosomal protein S18-alanine N-acetyltransferase [Gammaproteobacteria bacterium]